VRTALITGANRGIGLEVARQLGAQGLRVVLTGRDASSVETAAQSLQASHVDARAEVLDLAREADAASCAERLQRAGVHVDILVNNGAVYPPGSVLEATREDWRSAIDINFFGALWCCRAFLPAMQRAGYGRVVNVSSDCGSFEQGLPGPAPYSVAKAALNALTLKLGSEVRGDVKVNAVHPGWVRTRMGGRGASRSVEKGAETVVWLATLPSNGPNGGYFFDREPVPW
jgi:NAD(P)-dependent dehydrogenase (short-subunit alcohol dehydrogenase family)